MDSDNNPPDGILFLGEAEGPRGRHWVVVLIESGHSLNKTYYPPDVLRRAVAGGLFENLKACAYKYGDDFNHLPEPVAQNNADKFAGNVVGVFKNARYGKFKKPGGKEGEGVLADLHILEGAEWLRKNLRNAFELGSPDILGLSIDARGEFESAVIDGQQVKLVKKLTEVKSTDIVTAPAAGGRMLRLVASAKENEMDENAPEKGTDENAVALASKDEEIKGLQRQLTEKSISERLAGSGLPEKACEKLRKTLASREAISDDEIDAAIAEEREYIASLKETEADSADEPEVTGLGEDSGEEDEQTRIKVGKEEYDRQVEAVENMLTGGLDPDGYDPAKQDGLRFGGLHEAYVAIAKPKRFMSRREIADAVFAGIRLSWPDRAGVEHSDHVTRLRESWHHQSQYIREAIVTSDFPIAFGDALFRRLQKEYRREELNDWRMIVSSIENLADATNTFRIVRLGGISTLPVVAEKAPYQELADITEAEEQLTPTKKGGLTKFTWEDALADRLGVIRAIPRILGRTAARTVQRAVWDVIEQNETLDSDSTVLIDSTHNNQVSGDPALTYAVLSDAIEQLRNQTEQDSSEKLGLRAKWLIHGPDLEQESIEITESPAKQVAADDATTRSFVHFKGVRTLSSIELGRTATTDTHWWVMADPRDAETIAVGFLGGRDSPEIFVQSPMDTPTSGGAFDADVLTFKTRFVFGVTAVDFRWIVGSLNT